MISACTLPELKTFAESDLNGSFEVGSTDCNLDPVSATEPVGKECSALPRTMQQMHNNPSEPIALRSPTIHMVHGHNPATRRLEPSTADCPLRVTKGTVPTPTTAGGAVMTHRFDRLSSLGTGPFDIASLPLGVCTGPEPTTPPTRRGAYSGVSRTCGSSQEHREGLRHCTVGPCQLWLGQLISCLAANRAAS